MEVADFGVYPKTPAEASKTVRPAPSPVTDDFTPERIRALRGLRSRAAFAKQLGVTALTVYRWELPSHARESRRPRAAVLARLKAYGSAAASLSIESPPQGAPALHPVLDIERREYERLLPVLDRIPKGELLRAEAELFQLLAGSDLKSRAARALASSALVRLCVFARGDGRSAYSMLAPLLGELEAGGFPAAVEFSIHVTAALVFSFPDGRLFDAGKTAVHVTRAERLIDSHGSVDDRLLLWIARFAVAFVLNDQQLFERVLLRGHEVLHGHEAVLSRVIALFARAVEAVLTGRSALAIRRFEELTQLAQTRDLSLFLARALSHLADAMLDEAADPRQVLLLTERARRLAHENRHGLSVYTLLTAWAEGEALLRMAHFAQAQQCFEQALVQADELAWTPVMVALSFARLHALRGDTSALCQLGERLASYAHPVQRAITLAEAACMHALGAALDGADPRLLLEAFDAAERLAEQGAAWGFVSRNALLLHLSVRIHVGSLEQASLAVGRVERLLDVAPSAWANAQLRHWKGLLLCRHGRVEEGRKAIEAALATFELAGLLPESALARAVLAQLGAELGAVNAAQGVATSLNELQRLGIRANRSLAGEAISVARGATLNGADEAELGVRLVVPIARLSVRGMTPALIQRELVAVLGELIPGASIQLHEMDGQGTASLLAQVHGAQAGESEAVELGDGSGRRLRVSLMGPLPGNSHDLLTSLCGVAALALEVATLRGFAEQRGPHGMHADAVPELPGFVAASPAMRALKLDLVRLSRSRSTVIVTGDSGTGKEIVVRAIHDLSARAAHPFVVLNCAAVPRDLFEGQLFGYKKGAYTGASSDHPGMIRSARAGTLFLDEIGELPLDVQPKLLRFLENGEIFPLGERRAVQVDVRVIAATHRDLDELVRKGLFREDLYYRLQVVPVRVPPLCERREDIIALARHFLRLFTAPGHEPPVLSPDAVATLLGHAWPGNVRELRNVVERSLAFAPVPSVLDAEHVRITRPDPRSAY
jgi:tetratricopeptide (TPR) repeat protein